MLALSPEEPEHARRTYSSRAVWYCKGCKYDLRCSLRQRCCPECGRVFDPRDSGTYLLYVSRRTIWLDRASLLGQSFAFGWLAGFILVIRGTDVPFPPAIIASVMLGSVFGILILPFWWVARPYWRMWWFWIRSPR